MSLELSPFQADEVAGLLAVVEDELDGPDAEEWVRWGQLDGRRLTVLDAAAAVEDLEARAVTLEQSEPYGNGGPAARSLRHLAGRVRELDQNGRLR